MKGNINIVVRDHLILVNCGKEFATFHRIPDDEGLRKITFSIPLKENYKDILDQSGIVKVDKIDFEQCSITIFPRSFYETLLVTDLIVDILQKHEEINNK